MFKSRLRLVAPNQIGQYSIGCHIGSGSFAEVYSATCPFSSETLAVKVIPKSNLLSQTDIDRCQREIDAMFFIDFPHVVRLHDFLEDNDAFYLVMEYCGGGNLLCYLNEHGPLSEPVAALIFKQIAIAVAFCHHRGIAHRDLKLENVLITEFPVVKLTDFGLCGFVDPSSPMRTVCGSLCYCAPETFEDRGYEGTTADIWSLGILLYILVCRRFPWPVTNQAQMTDAIRRADINIPDEVPPTCCHLLRGLLTRDPRRRMGLPAILGHRWLDLSADGLPDLDSQCRALAHDPPRYIREVRRSASNIVTSDLGIISPFAAAPSGHPDHGPSLPLGRAIRRAPMTLPTLFAKGGSSKVRRNAAGESSVTPPVRMPRHIRNDSRRNPIGCLPIMPVMRLCQ
jgi:serine/threonine protein kinase